MRGRYAWNVEGGMWNEKCERAENLRGRYAWNVEGGMWNEKCERARRCEEGMRGMWKVECGMRNVKARGRREEGKKEGTSN